MLKNMQLASVMKRTCKYIDQKDGNVIKTRRWYVSICMCKTSKIYIALRISILKGKNVLDCCWELKCGYARVC